MFNSYIELLKEKSFSKDESRFYALQLLEMHKEILKRENISILELGVDKGQSTKVFLNAIKDKQKSSLISVDIRECLNKFNFSNWQFVKSDSANISYVVSQAPIIKKGIDILYIDSLHTKKHVYKEIYGYFEYLNKDACIFFDDVDSTPYMRNQRKDSVGTEIANREIIELIEAVFNSNLNQLNFSSIRGSTGLARLDKLSIKGEKLNKPKYIKKRRNKLIWKLIRLITNKTRFSDKFSQSDKFSVNLEENK
tara:strand:- start:9097 stop:9852 length:756 start_codon:yes stop_codon:yes gene_type:complete